MTLRQLDDLLDHPAIEQPKVTGIGWNRNDGDAVDDPVADVGDHPLDQGLTLAGRALRDHDLVAGPPQAHHLGNQPWRILQVAVDHHDRLTARIGHPADGGGRLPEAARKQQQLDARIALVLGANQLDRGIGARVGHEDDLVVLGDRGEDGTDGREEPRERLLLVIDGHNNRKKAGHFKDRGRAELARTYQCR